MNWFLYALQSLKDDRLYIGISKCPEDRLRQHNLGMTKSTKGYRPYKLIYSEQCRSRVEARLLEKKFKTGSGRELLKSVVRP